MRARDSAALMAVALLLGGVLAACSGATDSTDVAPRDAVADSRVESVTGQESVAWTPGDADALRSGLDALLSQRLGRAGSTGKGEVEVRVTFEMSVDPASPSAAPTMAVPVLQTPPIRVGPDGANATTIDEIVEDVVEFARVRALPGGRFSVVLVDLAES